ncbi:aldo/keto reductase [Dokdonella sp.]|uniref:aldo/keto reductase n=1 Tax=Dokdonella sp. TaxID=2291710 RepID=UPI003C506F8A
MTNRRQFIGTSTAVALGVMINPSFVLANSPTQDINDKMATRVIPSSGERVPVIGLGTSGSFEIGSTAEERDPRREVLRRFFAAGGTLIDTSPSYSTAEAVIGDLVAELDMRDKAFFATKLSGVVGRDAGLDQFNASLKRLKTDHVELLQVHNLGDWKTQLALARELKAEGKTKYVGLTHYLDRAQDDLADAVAESRPDFLQINYSVAHRDAEKRVLPMARDLGIAVLANRNFDDGKLFSIVKDKPLPRWAADAGASSWAQLFLRFVLSDTAVTAVIPATGKPDRESDNVKAGLGPILDSKQRASLIAELAAS